MKEFKCKHEWRFLKLLKDSRKDTVAVFYCIHCTKYSLKWSDNSFKELMKQWKKKGKYEGI